MWLELLRMLGKGPAPDGESFTELHCNALPGKPRAFVAKTQAGQTPGIMYLLRYIARMP